MPHVSIIPCFKTKIIDENRHRSEVDPDNVLIGFEISRAEAIKLIQELQERYLENCWGCAPETKGTPS